jgi:hypothetical protein
MFEGRSMSLCQDPHVAVSIQSNINRAADSFLKTQNQELFGARSIHINEANEVLN